MLQQNKSGDIDVATQNKKAIIIALKKLSYPNIPPKTSQSNFDAKVKDVDSEFRKIIKSGLDSEKMELAISELYSKINYSQIGTAMELINNIQFKYKWYKYSFIERDFGFFNYDFDDAKSRKDFLAFYSTHTEWQVYAHCLSLAKIDYQNSDQSLNFDKIFELLKYDVIGGYDQEVYPLIKLLELKFNTTLGFPAKLCNSNGVYGCTSADRIKVWMAYLKDNHQLKRKHGTTISFSYCN